MIETSRRRFLKGALYSSVLTLTGITSLSSEVSASESFSQDTAVATEIVTLINHTSSVVDLDNISGIAITELNDENKVTLAAGEESSFIVPAMTEKNGSANNKNLFITDVMMDGKLVIQSDYIEFNGVFPTSLFDKKLT